MASSRSEHNTHKRTGPSTCSICPRQWRKQCNIKSYQVHRFLRLSLPFTPWLWLTLYSHGAAEMGCNGTGHCVLSGMDSWLDGDGRAGRARPLWSHLGHDHRIGRWSEHWVHLQLSISHSAAKFQFRADMVGAGGFNMFSFNFPS